MFNADLNKRNKLSRGQRWVLNILAVLFCTLPTVAKAEDPSTFVYSEEIRLEKNLEDRVKTALDTMLGPNNSIVAVDVKLAVVKGDKLKKKSGGVLPGIPDISLPDKPQDRVDVDHIAVNVGVPETISDKLLAQVQNTVIELVGLNAERGDKLVVRKVQIVKDENKEIYRTEKEQLKQGGDPMKMEMGGAGDDKKKGAEKEEHDISAKTDINLNTTKIDTALPIRSKEAFLNEFTKTRNIFGSLAVFLGLLTLTLIFVAIFWALRLMNRVSNETFSYLREKQAMMAELRKMEAGLLNPDGTIPGQEPEPEVLPEAEPVLAEGQVELDANGEPVPAEGQEAIVAEGAETPVGELTTATDAINITNQEGGNNMVDNHEQGATPNPTQGVADGHAAPEGEAEKIIAADEVEPGKPIPFGFLKTADKARLAEVLLDMKDEEMVTVLSYLTPTDAATVIKNFAEEKQVKTLVGMSDRRRMSLDQVAQIEADLKERIEFTVGGAYQISRIIDQMGEETSKKVLASLQGSADKKDVFEKLRKEMILFEDMSLQGDDTMQKVFRNVDMSELSIALKGAPQELIDRVIKNLTEGSAAILQEEMEFGRSESAARISQAHENIAAIIRRMEQEGRVVFQRGGAAKA